MYKHTFEYRNIDNNESISVTVCFKNDYDNTMLINFRDTLKNRIHTRWLTGNRKYRPDEFEPIKTGIKIRVQEIKETLKME